MGIFGNRPSDFEFYDGPDLVGSWIGPRPEPQVGLEGWDAMGQIVPFDRRSEAYRNLKQMGFTDKEKMFRMTEMLADRIARDDVHAGMEELYQMGLDVTGIYRLVAVMLHTPREAPQTPTAANPDTSYLSLMEKPHDR